MHPQIPAQLRMKSHTQLAAVADGAGDGGEFEAGRQAVDALRQGVEAGRGQQRLGGAGGLACRGADAGAVNYTFDS